MWQRRQQRQQQKKTPTPKHAVSDVVGTAEQVAKTIGTEPKVLLKKAAAKAKAAGFCTRGSLGQCRLEEIRAWALKKGRSIGGTLGAYAKAIAGAVAKVISA